MVTLPSVGETGWGDKLNTAITSIDAVQTTGRLSAANLNSLILSAIPVTSVAGKTGAVSLTPFDVQAVQGPAAGTSFYNFTTHATSADTIQGYVPVIPPYAIADVQVAFSDVSTGAEVLGPQATVRAGIEYPEGTVTPVFFGGKRDGVIDGGGNLVSDPLSIDIPAGKVAFIRFRASRTAGITTAFPAGWPYGYVSGATLLSPNTTAKTGNRFDGLEILITRTVADAVINSGSFNLVSATAAFTPQDAGQSVRIVGAGAGGADLVTTIATYASATAVTLANSAGTSVSAAALTVTPADKTITGTIYNAQGTVYGYAPTAIFGKTKNPTKSVGLVGDSITHGQGDTATPSSGWARRAISPTYYAAGRDIRVMTELGYVQSSMPGETINNLIVKHATRFAYLGRCSHILGMLGTNDVGAGRTSTQMKADFITLVSQERLRGAKPYYGTLTPISTSTDSFVTTANQTVTANEANRVAFNDWLRDGAPIDPATLAPVAIGTSGAVRATFRDSTGSVAVTAFGGHPAEGLFELADSVESARNSGKWANVSGAALTADGTHPNKVGHDRMGVMAATTVATWV